VLAPDEASRAATSDRKCPAMSDLAPIRRALLSVSDKKGLVPFAQKLADHGVAILSTGGTARTLKEAGITVTDVSDVTGFPEIMDGRVKTLHPSVHGGLLAVREQRRSPRGHGGTRHRADRSSGGEPLPVRGHRRR
jgi:hypothetical protein